MLCDQTNSGIFSSGKSSKFLIMRVTASKKCPLSRQSYLWLKARGHIKSSEVSSEGVTEHDQVNLSGSRRNGWKDIFLSYCASPGHCTPINAIIRSVWVPQARQWKGWGLSVFPLALGSVGSLKHRRGCGGTQQDLANWLGAEGKEGQTTANW